MEAIIMMSGLIALAIGVMLYIFVISDKKQKPAH